MSNELTHLVSEELKQEAKLSSKEYVAINRRIQSIPERVSQLSSFEHRPFRSDLRSLFDIW